MFAVIRASLRAFAVGIVVGVLFAPRPGPETRKMLGTRIAAALDSMLELAALPPIEPARLRTNGHTARPAAKRTRSGANARTS